MSVKKIGVLVIPMAAALLSLACTVSADYSAEGFACTAQEPCPSGFTCEAQVCVAGGPRVDASLPDGATDDPDAAPIECLPPIALSDEFPGDTLDAQWTDIFLGGGTSAVVGAGVLTLNPRPNFGPERFANIRSTALFALAGKRVFFEVPAMVDSATEAIGAFRLGTLDNTFFFLRQSQGVLQFGTTIGGTELIVSASPYVPAAHRWWQLRMTGGRLYADLSADGTDWVTLDSVSADVITGDLFVEIGAGTRSSVVTPGAMQVDNVNAGSGLCL